MRKKIIINANRNGTKMFIVVYLVLNMLLAWPAPANPWYVAPSGTDDVAEGRGKSWSDPFARINYAVSRAGNGELILVTNNATYTLSDTINVTAGITIRSWSSGGNTDRYGTVVDGDGQHMAAACRFCTKAG